MQSNVAISKCDNNNLYNNKLLHMYINVTKSNWLNYIIYWKQIIWKQIIACNLFDVAIMMSSTHYYN